ncbi:methylmalonyl-CoA mutase family protein [Domibacillus epiphyticus]|nr:methylmalonyl-CoA mutase family protein [Domibacillus epiphyticus]
MKQQTFPAASYTDWEQAAHSSLKGKALSKLFTKTVESIELKPLYTKEDVEGIYRSLPGDKPFTRGFYGEGAFPASGFVLETDPLSEGAAVGVFPSVSMLQNIHTQQFITINTVPYHMAGANAVQELVAALSEAVFYMKEAEKKGIKKSDAASKLVVHFASGPRFFTELAKIRAFRTLWSALMDAYELDENAKPKISVETSQLTLSSLDPHVNILRTGSAAFAAVLANIDYLSVTPFDQLTGETSGLSERIAQNIPLLLRHESHLDKVIDPGGGSYYIESLTEEIGRLAWDEFALMEDKGGIEQALRTGVFQKEIMEVQANREHDAATRKHQLIGTNIYANIDETNRFSDETQVQAKIEGEKINPLMPKRLAKPFEQLRQKAVRLEQTEQSVEGGIICLGELKTNKPRVDYVTGVLAVGGIHAVKSENIDKIEEAVKFVKDTKLPYYCICGADAVYEEFGQELVDELKKAANGAMIDVAGKWQADGLNGSIAAGDNIVEKLSELLSLFEGRTIQ